MKIAIVSDLHAYNSVTWKQDGSPSYYDISSKASVQHCPMRSLVEFVKANSLRANWLLCPGDFANHACARSLPVAWDIVNQLGAELKSTLIAGTVGNHDVDSRYKHNKYDPLEVLKSLKPVFPVDDQDLKNHFWSEHFCIRRDANTQLVVLNSSAYHTNRKEVEHGRVADRTLELLRSELNAREINVLLCHHNPQKHSELRLGEHDEITGGQLLLDLIAEPENGSWIVIHGHKHHPKLTYASGNGNSPVVFSAGSVASTLYPELQGKTGNQFYIVEIDPNVVRERGLVGRFFSWDWHQGFGWRKAEPAKGLPHVGGFGHRENQVSLANRIVSQLSRGRQKSLTGDRVFKSIPELAYVTPGDLRALAYSMHAMSAEIEFDDTGAVVEVYLK